MAAPVQVGDCRGSMRMGSTRPRASQFAANCVGGPLASLALMASLDPTGAKRVLLCDKDGRPFVSGADQARSCSDRCC
jgi:hypothetical protein